MSAKCSYGMVILGKLHALCVLTEGHQDGSNNPGVPTRYFGHRLMDITGRWVNAPYSCLHCGRPCGDLAGGYAVVGNKRLCHPNVPDRPDCYRLLTVYHEVMGVRLNETELGFWKVRPAEGILQRALMQKSTRSKGVL